MFVKLTDAHTGEIVYVNPANVRFVSATNMADVGKRRIDETVTLHFDRDHAVTVTQRITDVLKALGDG